LYSDPAYQNDLDPLLILLLSEITESTVRHGVWIGPKKSLAIEMDDVIG